MRQPADAQSSQQKQSDRKPAEVVPSTPAAGVSAGPAAPQAAGKVIEIDTPLGSPADPPPELALARYRNLTQPTEDVARTYFMVDYISSSPFEWLPQLCPHGLPKQDAMSAAISAAALASLSLKMSDPRLMKHARKHYSNALYHTNNALSTTELAIQDSTLAAVLLLGLFEALVFTGQQSLDSWNAHAIGTVELLRLRGTRQFQTPLGRRLFLHSSGNIRTSCAHTKRPVPPRFLKLYEDAKPLLDLSGPVHQVAPLNDRLASLRSRIAQIEGQHRQELVLEALDLDAETVRIGQSVPEDWKFTARLPEESSPLTYKGISLRYPSLSAVRYWNSLRIIRMFLNDLIWAQSSLALNQGPDLDDDTDYEELQALTARNMSTLVVEVLASCGEYLESSERRFSVTARCLIWPLSVIANASLAPQDARQFASDCLERLGRDCRIPESIGLATGTHLICEAEWYVD
ncbi:putative C6 zinc finger domain-containing protein [Colletotrichum karsti]|uniref:C6 zinc finger domain-containing protein n=1 Tax=Colletotrichum karsti TaxID=1095194 RepID=A0A9P6LIB0_9PEZI|nr:putative C6 zinc finger domain-containing protein [Colletotrichum karsti]KAF9874423.1 putative C6 zinc finger domain-containing protein [Colletotrichum karsti]